MIKKYFIRKHWGYLVLPLMLLLVLPAHSQSAILKSTQNSELSIIRNYKNNVDITYSFMLDTISFNYIDRNTMTTHSIRLMNNPTVLDFVVFHDSVFFCGRCGQKAMYGYFDIYDAFFGSGIIFQYYGSAIPTPFLNNIDVATTQSGKTHMIMTGINYTNDTKNKTFSNNRVEKNDEDEINPVPGIIVEVWESVPGVNEIRYIKDDNLNYLFDDVIITDNYAVVTAHTIGSPKTQNFFYYKTPTPPTLSFLESWTALPAPSSSNTPMMTAMPSSYLEEVFITKIKRDSFAIACNNVPNGNVTISIYQDPTQQSIKRFEIPGVNVCNDFVYNVLQKTFYMMTTSITDDLCYTQYPFLTSSTVMDNDYLLHRWLSLDTTDNGRRVVLSGLEGISFSVSPKHFWLFDKGNINSCIHETSLTNINQNPTDTEGFYLQFIQTGRAVPTSFYTKPSTYKLTVECQLETK